MRTPPSQSPSWYDDRKDRPQVRGPVGRPHAVPLVGVWHDGAFAFCTGPDEQKQRNLDTNPQVAVTTGSTGAHGWDSGKDLVVEGTAVRVTDRASLQALAERWFAKYGDEHGQTTYRL